jgi:hypothetical protein
MSNRLIFRKVSYNVLMVLLLSVMASCFKKDDKVVLPPPGNLTYGGVSLVGPSYINQVYFQLSSANTVSNDHTKWDLAFESTANGYHIWINGGNQCLAANLGSASAFNSIKDTTGAYWRWDTPSWNADSTAIGNWTIFSSPPSSSSNPINTHFLDYRVEGVSESGVYIIDRGPAFASTDRFWKIIFTGVSETAYSIQYAKLDGSSLDSMTINKNSNYNYIYFSFDNNGQIVNEEPPKNNWDLLFTRYRFIFYHPTIPYLVEGVLINPYNTRVSVDSTEAFGDINYQFAKTLTYTTARDCIGWDWKTYTFSAGHYTVKPYLNYLIIDQNGLYWKLKFQGYYNSQGIEGYPTFEYQRL